ncbi:TEP isoform 2 [Penaeus vannamei]|uniref:TEP1-F n=1 Tax=Penaeus vannamei TaxID=6689 RepID=A0A423SFA9_PENVA|nr:TEP isoform 2 [Penaeus vannamei]
MWERRTYSVVAPRILRPNRDYHVVVSTHGTAKPVKVNVEVGGQQDSGGVILNRQLADLQPDSSQVLNFQIGDLGPGQYNLTVSGYEGLTFSNTTALQYVHKSYSVFIQTDKSIYKPGDLLQFRVIVVNPQLRPSVTGAIDVFITDGKGHRVKQWKRVFTNKGVWSGELLLAEEPVLGRWNITVDVLGQTTSRFFEVAYYVLPKFEVVVDLPEYATFDQKEFTATVNAKQHTLPVPLTAFLPAPRARYITGPGVASPRARGLGGVRPPSNGAAVTWSRLQYTYGRPVKGEVTLQVTPTYKYGYLQAPYDDPIRVVKQIKGKTDITINLEGDARLKGDYARELEVTAYVQEELTGRVQNSTAHVTVYRYPYRMSLVRTSDSFKPGLKYTAYLKVSYQDDTPVTSGEVTVRHTFTRDAEGFIETTHEIPASGVVTLDFQPPLDDDVVSLALEARFQELTQWLGEITRAQSPTDAFLQVTLLTQEPKVLPVHVVETDPLGRRRRRPDAHHHQTGRRGGGRGPERHAAPHLLRVPGAGARRRALRPDAAGPPGDHAQLQVHRHRRHGPARPPRRLLRAGRRRTRGRFPPLHRLRSHPESRVCQRVSEDCGRGRRRGHHRHHEAQRLRGRPGGGPAVSHPRERKPSDAGRRDTRAGGLRPGPREPGGVALPAPAEAGAVQLARHHHRQRRLPGASLARVASRPPG